ncbi:MAG: transglutaminase-like family protein, partial [Leptolyngbya sp. RL_3_1]|nr:transglutaminase-like family protein [Leptolyngbya sp. RL_3_1]
SPGSGVLEVNIHPVATWAELVDLHMALDDEAFACGLTCERYGLDGRPLGTGGGAHITIGGSTPASSPLLNRPDLLRSLITYWQHHPSLTYLFAGQFIGPTSQSPRVDEARHDSLYELEVAFLALAPGAAVAPELIDHLLSPFLADITGNTHRTALCIDKLFPTQNPPLQLGLLEFRSFEMPPHPQLRLLQMLLVRALTAWFLRTPFTQPLQRWGTELGDRYLLPHYLQQDFATVLQGLSQAGYHFAADWFTPFWERRFPRYGQVSLADNPARTLEVRAALEPWPVIGDLSNSGSSRRVDNTLERLQVRLTGAVGDNLETGQLATRYAVLCNGHPIPMRFTGIPGEYVGAVRFRVRTLATLDHPILALHTPLTLSVVDTWQQRSVGGAVYHHQTPDGRSYDRAPTTPALAQARLSERFIPLAEIPPLGDIPPPMLHPDTPMTLDLRLANQR